MKLNFIVLNVDEQKVSMREVDYNIVTYLNENKKIDCMERKESENNIIRANVENRPEHETDFENIILLEEKRRL